MTFRFLLISLFIFAPSSLATEEDVPLIEFKESLKNSSALDGSWRRGTLPCRDRWKGVECEGSGTKNVSGLILMNLGLSGPSSDIDVDPLTKLDKLRFLSLENNSFSGPIPEFNRLTALRSLYISGNQFSGEIAQDFFNNMSSLKNLELARNNFSGRIPESVAKLQNLVQLSMANNAFNGPVPLLEQQSLKRISFSYNKLQGEIPQNMSRFGAQAFEGNSDLCGSPISKSCPPKENNVSPPPPVEKSSRFIGASWVTKWVILAIVVIVLLATILFNKAKKRDGSLMLKGKEDLDGVGVGAVPVHIQSSNRISLSASRKGGGSAKDWGFRNSCRKSSAGTKIGRDLVMINEEKGVFGMQDLMKAAAEVLGSGGLGSAYKATMANGVSVVVKRLRDMNKLNKDSFDTEVRRLGKIRHRNILPPLAYHYQKEEKLLVSEFIPKGSLLFLLHGDHGLSHAELTWPVRLKIIKGVARGMGYLHTEFANYELPHGNLKSSNVLLSSNYEPVLTDYALYALISNAHSGHALFSYKSPEAVLYQKLSPKSDVYCLGIVILEIMTGKFPSQYHNNQKGGTDVVQWVMDAISEDRVLDLIDPEIANATDSLGQMEKILYIGADCTESDHDKRIEIKEAIRSIEEVQV